MIDVTNCPKIQDENRGVNEKLWIDVNGRPALFKKTQIREDGTHTNAHFSEALVYDICKALGYSCAEMEIAKRGNDIGCISYSFLDKEDELVDFNKLIQNIRISFDSKKMFVVDTNEKYSIPLILEAIEEECHSKEEFDNIKKEFLKSCIIDALIEHYDRNPSNIGLIKNKDGVRLSPLFDNGTSLWTSIPEEVIKENGDSNDWKQEVRERNKSKIGVEGERYSDYDRLLEYILSNYYSDVKEFLDVIDKELTPEKIQSIISSDKYKDLDETHKNFIVEKLFLNRQKLLEMRKKYERKYQIEELMGQENSSELLLKMGQNGELQKLIPEIEKCINLPQRNPYHVHDVDEYMFLCIENMNKIDELSKENGLNLKLSDKDKKIVQWTIMFNEMGKPFVREENKKEDGTISDTFRNYSKYGKEIALKKMEELNFYEIEKETVIKLIESHDKRNLDSDGAIRRFIKDIGEKNIDMYFAMKLAETYAKNPKIKEQTIKKLKELRQKIEKIQKTDNRKLINSLPIKGRQIMGMGMKGTQIGEVQERLAEYVRQNERIYDYYKSRGHLEKYRKELNQYAASIAKEIKHKAKAERLQQSVKESKDLDLKIQEKNQKLNDKV